MARVKPTHCTQTHLPTPVSFGAFRLYLKQESALPCTQTAKSRFLPAQFARANRKIMYRVITERLKKRERKTKRQHDQLSDQPSAAAPPCWPENDVWLKANFGAVTHYGTKISSLKKEQPLAGR